MAKYIFLLFFSLQALANDVTLSLDPMQTSVGEGVNLSVTIRGDLEGDILPPVVDGLSMMRSGTSTNMSWVNGRTTRESSYHYTLIPEKAGRFIIPSFSITINNQKQTTEPLTLVVTDTPQAIPNPRNARGNAQENDTDDDEDQPQQAEQGEPPAVFVTREFSKRDPFVFEPVVVIHKLYHRVGVSEISEDLKLPREFRRMDLDQEEKQETKNGVLYDVLEVRRVIIPQKAGTFEIPSYKLNMGLVVQEQRRRSDPRLDLFSQFFGGGTRVIPKTVASPAASLTVQPLPEASKPADFSGIVGAFSVAADVTPRSASQGDTLTVTVQIQGVGLLDALGKLSLKLPPSVKAYEDKPEVVEQAHKAYGVLSKRSYKFALVPKDSGEITLGRLPLWSFDPQKKQYVDLSPDLGTITIAPSPSGNAAALSLQPADSAQNVRPLGEDILDIHRMTSLTQDTLSSSDYFWGGILSGASFLCFLVFWIWSLLKRHNQANHAQVRRSQAYKTYKRKLSALKSDPSKSLDGAEYFQILKEYFGDFLGCHGRALTAKEIDQKLTTANTHMKLNLKTLLDEFEALSFSSQTSQTQEVLKNLEARVDALLQEVEKR